MSMDALINATLESLAKDAIPRLQKRLTELLKIPARDRKPDEALGALLGETHDLTAILGGWAAPEQFATNATESIPNQDDIGLEADIEWLATADEGLAEPGPAKNSSGFGEIDEAAGLMADVSLETVSGDDEMSDDDAMMMLAAMEGGDAAPAPTAASEPDGEMSDEEARLLLAAMDEPVAESPKASAPASHEEMSDEEARRLLAAMDEPVAPPAGAEETASDEEMSDEEARRLLAAMDEPVAAVPAARAPVDDLSAEDEAEALLARLGGADDGPSPTSVPERAAVKPQPPAVAPVRASASGGDDEESTEIGEWEPNDFQTDPDMVNDFITNAAELLETLDEAILKLEQNPEDKSIIEEIFRAAHTLKGGGGMFGFKALERVMHRMENLFDLVRKDKLVPTSDTVDVVFQGLDVIRTLLDAVKKGAPCGVKTGPIVAALSRAAKGEKAALPKGGGASPEPEAPSRAAASGGISAPARGDNERAGAQGKASAKKEQPTIRVDLDRLDALVNLVGELVIDRTRFVSIEEELRTNYPDVKLGGNISETVQLFGRHMNEIQDIIMKVRMVPIGNAFNKFTRIVRDLAKGLDKKIDLFISGESAELDKTLVEQIGDPLIHLIRNSCDHGIELPEDRVRKGKRPNGRISLGACQEGNHIVITIEDDGKGLPADILRRKGIERGLIKEEDVLSDRDIFNLIFEPGFSTAEKVTNISGRGVGMDVVKKQIMKLKGMIEIDSERDKGTTITIRLPLTLAIVQSLLVTAREETFAIPLTSVIESIRITPDKIQRVGDAEVIKLRDRVLPLMHLDETLGLGDKAGSMADYLKRKASSQKPQSRKRQHRDRVFIVVVGQPDRPFGIVVDQLLNQQEMVIKSMGTLMRHIPCVAGGALLGHGEVVLVLDIAELEEAFRAKSRGQAA